MSPPLVLATLTHSLVRALTAAVNSPELVRRIGQPVHVSEGPPERVDLSGPTDPDLLTIYAYRVMPAPQASARPTFEPPSANTPPPALSVHYLVTAYGSAPGNAECLIETVVRALQNPIPRCDSTTDSADASRNGGTLALIWEPLSTDELSRLWAMLGGHYRTSLTYCTRVTLT